MSAPAVAVLSAENLASSLNLALEIEQAYQADWDLALLEDSKRKEDKERSYQRAWDEALADDVRRTKNRIWAEGSLRGFEEYKLMAAKWLEDPMNRFITYECKEAAKRLKASKRKRGAA
jgi:hypothetical protein